MDRHFLSLSGLLQLQKILPTVVQKILHQRKEPNHQIVKDQSGYARHPKNTTGKCKSSGERLSKYNLPHFGPSIPNLTLCLLTAVATATINVIQTIQLKGLTHSVDRNHTAQEKQFLLFVMEASRPVKYRFTLASVHLLQ